MFSTGSLTVPPGLAFTVIPGLTMNITVPVGAEAYVSSYGGIICNAPMVGFTVVDVALYVDGNFTAQGAWERVLVDQGVVAPTLRYWSFGTAQPIAPGAHTIEVRAQGWAGTHASNAGGDSNSVLQGELTVVYVKQ